MVLYKREFLLNIIFLFLANLLIKPYYILFIERKFQNEVGTPAWGIYFTLFSLSMIPQILLDFGMTSYVNRQVAAHRIDSAMIWRQTFWLRPLFAVVFLIIFLLLTYVSGYLFEYPRIIFWISMNQILLAGILFIRAYISGLGYYRTDSLFSVSDKLLFILVFFFTGLFFPLNPLSLFLKIQFVSLLIPFLAGLLWISTKMNPGIPPFKFTIPIHILRECLPYTGIFILMVLFSRMEPVWIDLLRPDGARQSGLYAAAYRLLDAANMLGFLFAGILLPMFSNMISKRDQLGYQSLFDLAWKLMTAFAVLIAIPLVFYHRYIMQLLYEDAHEDVLNIVILNLIPLTINYLLSTLLTAANHARSMNRLFIISILINILGHTIFTARYGALGAAGTALITQCLTAILLAGFILHQKIVSIHWQHLKGLCFILAITGLTGWALNRIHLKPFLELIIFFVTTSAILAVSGLIPVKSILRLLFKSRST